MARSAQSFDEKIEHVRAEAWTAAIAYGATPPQAELISSAAMLAARRALLNDISCEVSAYSPSRHISLKEASGGLRAGSFFFDWQSGGSLDAPEHIPSGGTKTWRSSLGGNVVADGYVLR